MKSPVTLRMRLRPPLTFPISSVCKVSFCQQDLASI